MKYLNIGILLGIFLVSSSCLKEGAYKKAIAVFFTAGFSGQSVGLDINSDNIFVGNILTDEASGFACVVTGYCDNNNVRVDLSWVKGFDESIDQFEEIDLARGRFLIVMFSGDEKKPFRLMQVEKKPSFY